MDRHKRGKCAEDIAVQLLQQHQFDLLARNYHCRFGEIDIIAQQRQLIIFVEVRYRQDHGYGNAAESITMNKRRKITTTAEHFICHDLDPGCRCDFRFDVITLSSLDPLRVPPEWIQGAW